MLAQSAHGGRSDKAGRPIIEHITRVVASVSRRLPDDDDAACAAWLHAVVEDTPVTFADVTERFSPEVCEAVRALTRRPAENPDFYLLRVADNVIATIVKVAVLQDNLDPIRLGRVAPSYRDRLLAKYRYAQWTLLGLRPGAGT